MPPSTSSAATGHSQTGTPPDSDSVAAVSGRPLSEGDGTLVALESLDGVADGDDAVP
jgi:hypothetical protein